MLGELRGAGLVLGAITNGNAQLSETPLRDELAFCVSAGQIDLSFYCCWYEPTRLSIIPGANRPVF